MPSRATQSRAWVDTLAAYLTLVVAFLRLSWRVSTGRHALPPKPEGGATPEFAEIVHDLAQAAPMRPEVRA